MSLDFELSEEHQLVEKAVRDAMAPWTQRRAEPCIEVHGGNGFTEEYGFLDLYNGARLLKTAPVSGEMILNFVSEWDPGLPKSY